MRIISIIIVQSITKMSTCPFFPQPMDESVSLAISRGKGWLEHNLRKVERASRPLEAALVALALHEAKSTYAETAFGILARNARQEGKPLRFLQLLFLKFITLRSLSGDWNVRTWQHLRTN